MMPEEGAEDEEVYFRRRAFGKAGPTSGTERGLYLRGLQGMLGEMRRKRPPHLPYGHTQQLAVNLRQGTKATKVRSRVPRVTGGRGRSVWCGAGLCLGLGPRHRAWACCEAAGALHTHSTWVFVV